MAEKKTSKVVEVFPEGHEKAGQPTGRVVFTFSDDTTQAFDLSQVNEDIRFRLSLHGAAQKIGDSYAGAAGEDDALAFAKASVDETIKQLYAGAWRAAGGGGGPRVNELALAMARATGESIEDCVAAVAEMDDDTRKAFRKKKKIAAALAAIQAEKAVKRAAEMAKKAEAEDEDEAA